MVPVASDNVFHFAGLAHRHEHAGGLRWPSLQLQFEGNRIKKIRLVGFGGGLDAFDWFLFFLLLKKRVSGGEGLFGFSFFLLRFIMFVFLN